MHHIDVFCTGKGIGICLHSDSLSNHRLLIIGHLFILFLCVYAIIVIVMLASGKKKTTVKFYNDMHVIYRYIRLYRNNVSLVCSQNLSLSYKVKSSNTSDRKLLFQVVAKAHK